MRTIRLLGPKPLKKALDLLDRLEQSGYVRRVPSLQDRRVILIERTDKDRAFQELYIQVSQEMVALFYDGFSAAEIETFERFLVRILDNLSASKIE